MSETIGFPASSASSTLDSSFKFPLIFQFQLLSGREGQMAEGRTDGTAEKSSTRRRGHWVVTQGYSFL